MKNVARLIEYFIPDNYQLSLTIDRTERTFSGLVTLHGETVNAAQKIGVHAKDLIIESVVFDGKEATFTHGENDELYITHDDIFDGEHIVAIAFNGKITDAMHGMYPCYFEHDGVKKELIATQFESHHAREVFPCIDEPEAKATFDVSLTTEQDVVVLGNMPVLTTAHDNNKLVTTFQTTPRMSTYLLAWVTGELHKKSARTKSGVEVNVWATPAQSLESLDFSLDIATRTIEFFDEYFGVSYPLPKSDHVALPDFSSGAMENWGLITYREMALLADPKTTSISSKHYIATVVAHELSHQWFGNLVTMKWWNNLWLNESFATIMEYIAIDALHPEWQVWLDFSTMESIMALRRDSIDGVQAVQVDVHHPDEISTLFDGAIVYAKGARLLRMLQHYVGDAAFQTGLKAYFTTHAYKNTEADDLWNALAAASGKNVASLMNTWISQSGYPVVHVAQSDDMVTLKQEQFFVGPHKPSDKLWPIPLEASSSDIPELLEGQDATVTRRDANLLRLNVGDTAHFVTHYDQSLLARLIDAVKASELEPLDRLQLLHEQTLLARGGVMSSAELIQLIDAYKHESTESVWDIISVAIGDLKMFVEFDHDAEQKLRALAANVARDQYERLGWVAHEGESESDSKMRSTIIANMLYGENQDAIATAIKLYNETPLEDLDPELRSLIIGAAVRHSEDNTLVTKLIERYKATQLADLQQDIASGMTSTRNADDITKILACIKDDSVVRPQDAARWFVWTIRNRDGKALAWQWVQDNWQWVKDTFGGDKSYDDYPRYSAGALTTREQLEQYKTFFAPMQQEPALERVISMGVSEIEGRVAHIERDGEAVRTALNNL